MTLDKLAVIVGKNIAQLRKEKGITQKVFAEQIKMTENSLTRMEKGWFAPKMSRIQEIANALDCSTSDIFKDEKAITIDRANIVFERIKDLPIEVQNSLLELLDYNIDMIKKNKK